MRSPARRRPGARRARRGARPLRLAPPRVPSSRRRAVVTRSCSSVSAAARNASGRSSRPADAASRSIARSRCRVSDRRRGSAASARRATGRRLSCARQADGPAPAVEEVADVRLAEFDPERTPGFSGAVPFGAQVDPAEDDAERHPLLRPLPHQRETRPDNADQVPCVHAGQMVFDLAAIITDVEHSARPPSHAGHPRLNRSQMTSPAMSRRVWPFDLDDQPAIVVDVPSGAAPPGVVIGPVGDRAAQAGAREPPPLVTDPPAVARPQPCGGVGDRGEDLDHEPSAIDGRPSSTSIDVARSAISGG